ncbi:basement membrane-specific heparan sulfate proteoglycan core protein-like isoform X2 [Oppia nitens]|uniref:basement membrane-specific heparan sulfate proteoglycan core protein-like isoform X2 n=1 Tax=Oppia nitens TaxID=1686743 RepID=UPI0023DCCB84|nr:basement membrane-specific heparan sulfate proteoglycan core protein-like isoform X2 [Oppia nitens]
MKIISIILILCLIQVSLCAYLDYGSESALVDSSNNSEDEDSVGDRQPDNPMITKLKLQADSDADLDDEDESNGDGLVNQDDDNEPDMPKVDATQAPPELQPQPPVANQPDIAGQPSRGYPGINEPAPQTPDYSAYANRVYECHSGQYQCQKVEASAPTRCIPNEWRCNGVRDCENNDDESSCSASGGTGPRTDIKCSPEQYKCHGGACIERQYVCILFLIKCKVTAPITARMETTRPTVRHRRPRCATIATDRIGRRIPTIPII